MKKTNKKLLILFFLYHYTMNLNFLKKMGNESRVPVFKVYHIMGRHTKSICVNCGIDFILK